MSKPFPFTVCKECASGSGGGVDGLSAYEIAVKNGFVGSEEEWLESLKAEITDEDIAKIIKAVDEAHAHRCMPADGELVTEKKFSYTIPTHQWIFIDEEYSGDIETGDILIDDPGFDTYMYFKVIWNGKEYTVTDIDSSKDVSLRLTDESGKTLIISIYSADYINEDERILFITHVDAGRLPEEAVVLEIIPYTGPYEEQLKQLDPIFIPDYVSKTYVDSLKTHGTEAVYGEKTVFDLSESLTDDNFCYYDSPPTIVRFEKGKQYAVKWRGKMYICNVEEDYDTNNVCYIYRIQNKEIEKGKDGYFCFEWLREHDLFDVLYYGYTESCEIMPYSEEVEQLDTKYIPDYVSKTEVEETVGNIETALDSIIAMQNELIGGDTV